MIAELHGKISSRGTNLRETLEDNLTGNVFGSLRYIPFSKGIKPILLSVIDEQYFGEYEAEEWAERIEFWPYDKEGELDSVINLDLVSIAIEVKYNSKLSSEDDVSNEYDNNEKSINQLARESRIIKEIAKARGTAPILLFIARENEGKEIINNVLSRNIIEADVMLKFISWEDICTSFESLFKSDELSYFEKIVVGDIHKLLIRKGFNRFKDFKASLDNEVVIEDKYYVFKDSKKNELNINNISEKFSFISNINVNEGEYYEFI
ncbi:hypothetical protein [Clostridium folliculivorans]|uniref:hypothetical protein n=1 Tax=Clostridium folliculivorans TaxID=2886038 RepID=UPI0021C30112|nr:hypothetical protein [Clostridium folliculivorans]GKU30432.1 hypothetical protein CFB3_25390 [Clostridium folliculivorans]